MPIQGNQPTTSLDLDIAEAAREAVNALIIEYPEIIKDLKDPKKKPGVVRGLNLAIRESLLASYPKILGGLVFELLNVINYNPNTPDSRKYVSLEPNPQNNEQRYLLVSRLGPSCIELRSTNSIKIYYRPDSETATVYQGQSNIKAERLIRETLERAINQVNVSETCPAPTVGEQSLCPQLLESYMNFINKLEAASPTDITFEISGIRVKTPDKVQVKLAKNTAKFEHTSLDTTTYEFHRDSAKFYAPGNQAFALSTLIKQLEKALEKHLSGKSKSVA
ncbi:MAG: hypothetical protein R3A13_11565 [Bdellovibrionota bacterium]